MKDNRVYVNVYFRVDAGYVWGRGMEDSKTAAFYQEVTGLLLGVGFAIEEPRMPSACPEAMRGIEHLYCHPMELSGYVSEESIDEIETMLAAGVTFQLRCVDTYERVSNYSESEFAAALEDKRHEIEEKITDLFKTKRRNLYLPDHALDAVRSGLHFLKRGIVGIPNLNYLDGSFIRSVFDGMVEDGRIVSATINGVVYYRARSPRDAMQHVAVVV